MIERLGHALRFAADAIAPPPPRPSPKIELTVTRSRRKLINGVEWLPDALDQVSMSPPLQNETMGPYDTLDLDYDVHGFTADGKRCTVQHTFHLRWREVQP